MTMGINHPGHNDIALGIDYLSICNPQIGANCGYAPILNQYLMEAGSQRCVGKRDWQSVNDQGALGHDRYQLQGVNGFGAVT